MSDHLTPEELFEFIDQGGGSGPADITSWAARNALFVLDLILLAEVPPTPEEEAALKASY